MPWTHGTVMESRREFIRLAQAGDVGMAEPCRRFDISRQTGRVFASLSSQRRWRSAGSLQLPGAQCEPLPGGDRIMSHDVV